jgi:Uma2 family endonuclease
VLINNESTLKTAICELVDQSNTKAEIVRKIDEYFAAGTHLVWVVDLKTRTVRVHTAPGDPLMLDVGDVLDGGDVLPGLRIPVGDLFELGE